MFPFLLIHRKDQASPEDIDYFECQQEMVQELYQQHMHVERIIGTVLLMYLFQYSIVIQN